MLELSCENATVGTNGLIMTSEWSEGWKLPLEGYIQMHKKILIFLIHAKEKYANTPGVRDISFPAFSLRRNLFNFSSLKKIIYDMILKYIDQVTYIIY